MQDKHSESAKLRKLFERHIRIYVAHEKKLKNNNYISPEEKEQIIIELNRTMEEINNFKNKYGDCIKHGRSRFGKFIEDEYKKKYSPQTPNNNIYQNNHMQQTKGNPNNNYDYKFYKDNNYPNIQGSPNIDNRVNMNIRMNNYGDRNINYIPDKNTMYNMDRSGNNAYNPSMNINNNIPYNSPMNIDRNRNIYTPINPIINKPIHNNDNTRNYYENAFTQEQLYSQRYNPISNIREQSEINNRRSINNSPYNKIENYATNPNMRIPPIDKKISYISPTNRINRDMASFYSNTSTNTHSVTNSVPHISPKSTHVLNTPYTYIEKEDSYNETACVNPNIIMDINNTYNTINNMQVDISNIPNKNNIDKPYININRDELGNNVNIPIGNINRDEIGNSVNTPIENINRNRVNTPIGNIGEDNLNTPMGNINRDEIRNSINTPIGNINRNRDNINTPYININRDNVNIPIGNINRNTINTPMGNISRATVNSPIGNINTPIGNVSGDNINIPMGNVNRSEIRNNLNTPYANINRDNANSPIGNINTPIGNINRNTVNTPYTNINRDNNIYLNKRAKSPYINTENSYVSPVNNINKIVNNINYPYSSKVEPLTPDMFISDNKNNNIAQNNYTNAGNVYNSNTTYKNIENFYKGNPNYNNNITGPPPRNIYLKTPEIKKQVPFVHMTPHPSGNFMNFKSNYNRNNDMNMKNMNNFQYYDKLKRNDINNRRRDDIDDIKKRKHDIKDINSIAMNKNNGIFFPTDNVNINKNIIPRDKKNEFVYNNITQVNKNNLLPDMDGNKKAGDYEKKLYLSKNKNNGDLNNLKDFYKKDELSRKIQKESKKDTNKNGKSKNKKIKKKDTPDEVKIENNEEIITLDFLEDNTINNLNFFSDEFDVNNNKLDSIAKEVLEYNHEEPNEGDDEIDKEHYDKTNNNLSNKNSNITVNKLTEEEKNKLLIECDTFIEKLMHMSALSAINRKDNIIKEGDILHAYKSCFDKELYDKRIFRKKRKPKDIHLKRMKMLNKINK